MTSLSRRTILATAFAAFMGSGDGRTGRQRRRHADRLRRPARHRIHPDAGGDRARQGARRQCRTHHPERRGSGRAGDRRRPGRCRHRRALHADPEGRRADPHLRADFDAALLPRRQRRILQDLEGPRRPGRRGAGARLRHRGGHAADGEEQRHHAWHDQLCSGLGGSPQRAYPGHAQGIDRRRRQPPRAGSRSARQVRRAAGRESRARPTKRCSPPPTISRTTPPMSTSSSRS